jgi:2'-5' RNA ligase
VRLFVALPLPEKIRAALVDFTHQCGAQPALRWTPAQQLHITLHFLDEVADERLNEVIKALNGIAAPEFHVDLERIDMLGRANILVAAARLAPPLAALAEIVRSRTAEFTDGVVETAREFHPHVTLARARRGESVPKLRSLPPLPSLEFSADCFRLYRSELSKDGAVHAVVHEWKIG